MLVNITKAAKLAGITRETLYKNYINKGKISTTRDERNRPMVDISELLRVFGTLTDTPTTPHTTTPNTHPQSDISHTPPDTSAQLAQLKAENAQLLARLEEAKEREQWQRGQIEKLTDTIKLLEAPRTAKPATLKQWWKSLF